MALLNTIRLQKKYWIKKLYLEDNWNTMKLDEKYGFNGYESAQREK